jgi:hypothetical protein
MRLINLIPLKEMENPCWKGYEMVGTKKKDGREVPNCVPVKENVVSEAEVVDTQTKPDTQESEEVITSSEETPSFNTAPNIVLNKERKKNRY